MATIYSRRDLKSTPVILALAVIVAFDFWLRASHAWNSTNFLAGDALAPFSILDQFYRGEEVDLSRQSWLLPLLLGRFLSFVAPGLGYQSLFGAYAVATSVASSSTLLVTYALAQRFLSPLQALIPVGLLAANTSFLLHSMFPNPTQVYALIFTGVLLSVDRQRWAVALGLSALGLLVRWEGALLLVLVTAFITGQAWRGHCARGWLIVAPLCAFGVLAVALVIHLIESSTAFGFLVNTNAVKPAGAALTDRSIDRVQLLVSSLNWKFEHMNAFGANMTLIGVILAAIGGYAAGARYQAILLAVLYWLGYEAAMLLYTLVVPIGNITMPLFTELLSTAPVARYYQVFTPLLCILAFLGLRAVMTGLTFEVLKKAVVGFVLGLYGLHQLVIFENTYRTSYFPFGRNGFVADIIGAAEQIRATGARGADIVLSRDAANGLEYTNVLQGNVGGYQLHAFHFSILSGRNRTNCTGYNLENPNLFCSELSGSKQVNLDTLPLGGRAEFIVVVKPSISHPQGFAQIYENGTFLVLRRQKQPPNN